MTTEQVSPAPAEESFDVIGTRPIRHDGPDKVTGRARYAADIHPPGWLAGKILRSPHAHARIRSIDATRALAVPGVKAVVTSHDFPEVSAEIADQEEGATVNYGFYSRNVMAREKALYVGHAIAAVAATSAAAAEEALAALDVDYEVLAPVLNADDAMRDDAPLLHERLVTLANPNLRQGGWGDANAKPSNVSNRFEFRLGDPEAGFAGADVIVEREFHTRPVHQGYIEPHSATAQWSTDGSVTIWASSQGHFEDYSHGDWRRVRRQRTGRLLSGAGGCGPIPQVRPACKDCYDPGRGVRGHRSNLGQPHSCEVGRHPRGQAGGGRLHPCLRGRGIPWLSGAIGLPHHAGAV